ncbi:hypothetical protein B0H13DRAFT_1873374 [Mycena leptocephala]|nr:hypothetical protein B0H13DRAFT_1873374 [Mycena leptocephala]
MWDSFDFREMWEKGQIKVEWSDASPAIVILVVHFIFVFSFAATLVVPAVELEVGSLEAISHPSLATFSIRLTQRSPLYLHTNPAAGGAWEDTPPHLDVQERFLPMRCACKTWRRLAVVHAGLDRTVRFQLNATSPLFEAASSGVSSVGVDVSRTYQGVVTALSGGGDEDAGRLDGVLEASRATNVRNG